MDATASARATAEALATGHPFAARSALSRGLITRHALSTRFTAILPGINMTDRSPPTGRDRIAAASLWAPEDAVLAGWAAARLHNER